MAQVWEEIGSDDQACEDFRATIRQTGAFVASCGRTGNGIKVLPALFGARSPVGKP